MEKEKEEPRCFAGVARRNAEKSNRDVAERKAGNKS
jgi:hypothetical protein